MNENNMGINDMKTKSSGSHGALVGSIIVVVLLIVGGIYYWQTTLKRISTERTMDQQAAMQDQATINTLQTQSSSDEVTDLDKDIQATDVNGLDISVQ